MQSEMASSIMRADMLNLVAIVLGGPTCALAGPPVIARWSDAIPAVTTAAAPLRVVADIALPGSTARFDYQSLDTHTRRLFISNMGTGRLMVLDMQTSRVITNLDDFPVVTGVLAVPAEHRVYASATGD